MREPARAHGGFSDDAAAVRFDGDERGVLLLHGFTGTPFEMRFLGEHLAGRGYSVVAPRLAGHVASPAELGATTWLDWYASAEAAFDELRARTRRVAVVGLSMGGLLTLELGRRRGGEVAAIGLLATALRLQPWLERAIRWVGRRRFLVGKTLPKWGGSDIADAAMKARNPATQGFPVSALGSLLDCMEHVGSRLGEVHQPAFIAHARHDHTIPFACHETLLRGIGSRAVEPLVLERSFHVMTLDVERQALFTKIESFLDKTLAKENQ